MRAYLLESTALQTTIALEARADGPAVVAGSAPAVAAVDQDQAAGRLGISAHSLCSDGEIFLAGEVPVEVALRR